MARKFNLIIALSILLVMVSCSDEKVTNPTINSYGSAEFVIPKKEIPSNISIISVELSREGFSTIGKTVVVDENFEEVVSLTSIPIGMWSIEISARDGQGVVKYLGESSVEILQNQTVLLSVTLNPVGTSLGVGSLLITVNWGSSGLPDDWEYYDNNPVIKSYLSAFDARGVTVSYILKEDNGYKMWYGGLPSEVGGKTYIFHAKSSNGLNWEKHSYLPVLFPGEPGEWDDEHVGEPTVIKINNKYVMYYGGYSSYDGSIWSIGRAESNDGINWIKDENPVLNGRENNWDQIITPQSVLKINGMYHLYYSGRDNSSYKIGLAISQDGKVWERYSNQPILTSTKEWEGFGVYYPDVHLTDNNIYEMYYMNAFANESSVGRAYSADGINWEKDAANPYLKTSNFLDVNLEKITYPRFIKNQNSDLLFFTKFEINGNKTINLLIRSSE